MEAKIVDVEKYEGKIYMTGVFTETGKVFVARVLNDPDENQDNIINEEK